MPYNVFVSYSFSEQNKRENIHLAEEIIRPVLEMLGFTVCSYYKNHSQRVSPIRWVEEWIKGSQVLVALLTKDLKTKKEGNEEWHPKANILHEIGMAEEDCLVIPFSEKGVIIPSNILTKYHCPPFTRMSYGELLVELLETLKDEKML